MRAVTRLSTAALAAAFVFSAPLSAQVMFSGFTNGCFGAACVPETVSANVTDVSAGGTLLYRNSTFSGMTTPSGLLAIGNTSGNPNTDNLGSFTLSNGSETYVGQTFNLRVSFTQPAGTTPDSRIFTSNLQGQVIAAGADNGGVIIQWLNPTQNFTFNGGTFSLTVDNLSIQGVASGSPSKTVAVTGFVQASVVPEPSTYLLMATGLAGVFVAARRRRQA